MVEMTERSSGSEPSDRVDQASKPDEVAGKLDDHADKYNDPRVKVTRRGVWMGVGVLVFAVVATAISVTARRTQLQQTTDYFGPQTILALQLGERIQLVPKGQSKFETVELTGTPGLGHLRRALLDDRHYDWATSVNEPVSELCQTPQADCVQLLITDPTAHRFDEVLIDLELSGGWVGLAGESNRVRVTERVQPALKHFLNTLLNVKQKSYDDRE